MKILLILLCEWIKGYSNFLASIELDISLSTVNRWFTRFNNFAYNYVYHFLRHQTVGGPGCIDDTVIVRNKYHNGMLLQHQMWAVVGVVRGDPNTLFFEIFEDGTRNMVIELIKRKLLLIYRLYAQYLGLESICVDMGYSHETANHLNNFVDPDTDAHKQTIEGMGSVIKELRKSGTNYSRMLYLVKKVCLGRFKYLYRNT